ncbi:uncharacterized protein LOC143564343 [Bidens hawaiensis]|uniref:uncharacterized protein LOC143564343 n=1 Tax=Bidens hawaiensis TaxID=980011 RepID=UPI004049EF9A
MSQEQSGSRPARRKRPRRQPVFDPVAQRYSRRICYEVEEIPIEEASVDEIKGDEDTPHIILRFSLNTTEKEIYDRIWEAPLLRHRTFNWELLGTLGQAERVRTLLGPRWATILRFDRTQYVKLVHEFYATFRHKTGDLFSEHVVLFSLGRQLFEMSVPRFAVLTGLYTEEEVQTSAFTESVRGYTLGTRRYWITSTDLAAFRSTIAEGPHASNAVSSAIRDPVHRYIHIVITSTFVGRQSGHDKCSNLDLMCLYSIIGQHDVNLATLLLSSMGRGGRRDESVSARLPLGHIISQIAAALGVFEKYSAAYLTPGLDTEVVNVADAKKAGMCTYEDPPRLVDARVSAGAGSSS